MTERQVQNETSPCNHIKASWDSHSKCRRCRACSKDHPCAICVDWPEEFWAKTKRQQMAKEKEKKRQLSSSLPEDSFESFSSGKKCSTSSPTAKRLKSSRNMAEEGEIIDDSDKSREPSTTISVSEKGSQKISSSRTPETPGQISRERPDSRTPARPNTQSGQASRGKKGQGR